MSFKTRVFAAFLALLLLSGCRGEAAQPRFGADEPHFEFEDVRTVISLLQMHFVDPVAEEPLVEAGCEAIDDFVDEGGAEPSTIEKLLRKGASRPSIRCDAVDTVGRLREIYEDAVDGGADPSALAVVANVGITHSLGHSHTGFTSISADDAGIEGVDSGLSWIRRDGALLVWDVEAGSAASERGLRPGDKVVAIDGVDIRGWRGITDPHDPLGLKVLRPDAAPFEVELSLETRKTSLLGGCSRLASRTSGLRRSCPWARGTTTGSLWGDGYKYDLRLA